MHQHSFDPAVSPPQHRTVALVGNPNTGKSTLFNGLTGYHQRVGNFAGVTVEKHVGYLRWSDVPFPIEVTDLPGAYSLSASAEDEAVVLDTLLGHAPGGDAPDLIVVVVDAAHLGRNLFFASQVLEVGRPVVIALNMVDLAETAGLRVDADALGRLLGVPVVPVVATRQHGIQALIRAVTASLDAPPPTIHPCFPAVVTAELDGLVTSLAGNGNPGCATGSRAAALQLLLDRGGYHEERLLCNLGPALGSELDERRGRIEAAGHTLVELEARVRYDWINGVVDKVVHCTTTAQRSSSSDAIDRVLTNRVAGLLILMAVMALGFQAIYGWAAPVMNAIDGVFLGLGAKLSQAISPGPLQSLLADGVIAGVGAVLVFLPQILILFLFLAILEDVGYLARAALLLDRWMGMIGLNGRSLIPLLSCFACAVPGIMATRVINDRRDRLATILIAPLMSCSARLPVYVLLVGAFVPSRPLLGGVLQLQAVVLFALYALGVVVAVPVVLIVKRFFLRGPTPSFLMELPTYKWPSPRTILLRVLEQGKEFCVSAGTIIFAVAIIIWAMGYYPRPAAIAADHDVQRAAAQAMYPHDADHDALHARIVEIDRSQAGAYLRQSVLGRIGQWIEPIVRPLGWDWRIGTAAVAAFPAREVVIA
ncbi:MAG: ferrous iron transport protein B, partial [Phycisphaerae bacterium]